MLRAIAHGALLEAAHHREYRASFHGFQVHARRERALPGFGDLLEVRLCVTFGNALLACELIERSIHDELEPIL